MLLLFLRFIDLRQIIDVGQVRRGLCVAGLGLAWSMGAGAASPTGPIHEAVVAHPVLDRSGHKRRGKASFYAGKFAGRKMADGTIMEPQGDNAASKTLPLGTTARVTNLENGRSVVVTIRDRGPYIQGRIVDLSPSTAKQIGIERKNGIAKVEVAPIVVPLPDGHVKLGAAVTDGSEQIERFASSADNFAHLTDAWLDDLMKISVGR
jgi:rare lipoprotein A